VTPFAPPLRVERGLEARTGDLTVNVLLQAGEPTVELQAAIATAGGSVLRLTGSELQARLPASAVASLAAVEGVRWIEEARRVESQNATTTWLVQSGQSGFRSIWDRGLRGEGQIVGIGDSGIDWDHECFFDPARPTVQYVPPGETRPPDLAHRKIVNYWLHVGDAADQEGHGTHTAGTIACDNSSLPGSSGGPHGLGVAPQSRLSFSDMQPGTSWVTPMASDVVRMFDQQYADGARLQAHRRGAAPRS
jgi:subtilisin family serine protease